MLRRVFIVLCAFFISVNCYSQDIFKIIGGQESHSMRFELINNLIIIPVKVNGSELNFLLDTGVNNTIMFNLSLKDSLRLKNTEKIRLRGLGEGEYIDAIKSTNNVFRIGKIANGYHMIYLIPGKEFDLSANLGVNINGIIGGDLFHDFIVDINYTTKRLKFYKPSSYIYKRCKKCQTFDLDFYKNKPYINLIVQSKDTEKTTVKLLIDSGASDALWLFEKSNEKIKVPENHYVDYLGKGLSGNIYGKRSKINKIIIGDYIFTNANVAYPDSSSIKTVYKHKDRNGTLGSELLKRFRVVIDYPAKKITFKKKSRYFNTPFLYDMSGIELSYSGKMLVRERQGSLYGGTNRQGTSSAIEIVYNYVYAFKQSYQIEVIRKKSPAEKAGLLVGDVILQINGKPAFNYKLQEITHMFSAKEGKQIRLLIDRGGEVLTYSFRLKRIL
ncbi:MAG: aspartyl protease family protein [Flavobacteriaceae bacterium]|nr:aspartyl protease family protein [Flavobacteriaceae bacterium]